MKKQDSPGAGGVFAEKLRARMEKYTGTIGRTQGVRNEARPAPRAARIDTSAMFILPSRVYRREVFP